MVSPLNYNANNQNCKGNNHQDFDMNIFNSNFNYSNYNNPLAAFLSPCNNNFNIFNSSFTNKNKEENIFENFVNPLSGDTFHNFANKNNGQDDKNENSFYNNVNNNNKDNNASSSKKIQLPSLNLDIINKADTFKIFVESILSSFDVNSPTSEVRRPQCISNLYKHTGETPPNVINSHSYMLNKLYYDNHQ